MARQQEREPISITARKHGKRGREEVTCKLKPEKSPSPSQSDTQPTNGPKRLFRGELATRCIRSCDVEVFAKMYGGTDVQAAKDLIELEFDGNLIGDCHLGRKRTITPHGTSENPSTRRTIAEEVFLEYIGEPTRR